MGDERAAARSGPSPRTTCIAIAATMKPTPTAQSRATLPSSLPARYSRFETGLAAQDAREPRARVALERVAHDVEAEEGDREAEQRRGREGERGRGVERAGAADLHEAPPRRRVGDHQHGTDGGGQPSAPRPRAGACGSAGPPRARRATRVAEGTLTPPPRVGRLHEVQVGVLEVRLDRATPRAAAARGRRAAGARRRAAARTFDTVRPGRRRSNSAEGSTSSHAAAGRAAQQLLGRAAGHEASRRARRRSRRRSTRRRRRCASRG